MLSTLVLGAAGSDVVVREGSSAWIARTGQYSLPLDSSDPPSVTVLRRPSTHSVKLAVAETHYARAHALEDTDIHAARQGYLDALSAHGEHLDARINLGRLLHLQGELAAAERVYRGAKRSSALLSFNLANLLEDLDRHAEAIEAYHEALAQEPDLFDAHFNLSRLYEIAQDPRKALRHLLVYRRHVRRSKG